MGTRIARLYLRVSHQRNGRSVEQQHAEGLRDCDAEGLEIAQVYQDPDRSASRFSTKHRSDWLRLNRDLRTGEVVWLWESSRGDRTLSSWVQLLDTWRDLGVLVRVYRDRRTYDLRIARDWKTLAEDGVSNAFASEETSERIKRHLRANALAGRPHGRLLYGYRREYDPHTREFLRQVPCEDQAPVVQEAARRVTLGETTYAIARDFNLRGVPTMRGGIEWSPDQVSAMVLNPGYIGKRVHNGKIVGAAAWPAIVEPETYYTCQQILTDPARGIARNSAAKHLLTGIALCGVCGAALRVLPNRGYPSYYCSGKRGNGKSRFCTNIKETKLDEYIELVLLGGKAGDVVAGIQLTDDVVGRMAKPDFIKLMADRNSDDATATARAEAAQLRTRLQEHYDQAADGQLSAAGLAAVEARILPKLEKLDRDAARVVSPLVRELAGPDPRCRWEALTMEQRRNVIRVLMKIRLLPVGRGRRTFDPARVDIIPVGQE